MNALTSRGTWVPLLGAGVVSIDDWDQEISNWAVENTPIFDRLRLLTGRDQNRLGLHGENPLEEMT